MAPGRSLKKEGDLCSPEACAKGVEADRHVFLFTDVIVVTKPRPQKGEQIVALLLWLYRNNAYTRVQRHEDNTH